MKLTLTVFAPLPGGSAVTLRVPETPDAGSLAVSVTSPAPATVASPLLSMETTLGFDELQVTTLVMSLLDPSLNCPWAPYCCWPPPTIVGSGGKIAIDCSNGTDTVMLAAPLMPLLESVAVIVAVPAFTPETSPLPSTDATSGAEELQAT